MSIILAVRDFIAQCPHMDRFTNGKHIDWVDEIPENYGIENNGDTPIKNFLDGSSKHKYDFMLLARNFTAEDADILENSGFCEDFMLWVENKNLKRERPVLDKGFTPVSISADNGMLFYYDKDATTGVYQIQLHLIYIKKGER